MSLLAKRCCVVDSSTDPTTAHRTKRHESVLMIVTVVASLVMMFMGAVMTAAVPPQSAEVFICESKGATSYHHYRDCKLLGQCKAKVATVKEMSARGKGRDRCDACNKRMKSGK